MKTLVTMIAGGLLASACLTSSATAGGPETLCDGTPWLWDIDSMLQTPANGVPWKIARTQGTPRTVMPGFPGLACSTGGATRPAVYSLVRGARAWTKAQHPALPTSPGSNVSRFAFSDPHTSFTVQSSTDFDLTGPNGSNVVTCLEAPSFFTPFGDPPALTSIWLNASGNIIDSDIAINAGGPGGVGTPQLYAFIESNSVQATSYISSQLAPVTGLYFDLQGLVTNSFGRAAGLEGSLVQGEYDASAGVIRQPSMFPIAKAQRFTGAVDHQFAAGCGSVLTQTLTNIQLLAREAQTLELDDVVSIATAYPKPVFSTALGSITGIVDESFGFNHRVGHVMAMSASDPANDRVGATVRADGSYTIQGLAPGEYFVHVDAAENVNTATPSNLAAIPDPNGTTWTFSPYYLDGELPYRWQQGAGGAPWDPTPGPCPETAPFFALYNAEVYDVDGNDGVVGPFNCECDQAHSAGVQVTAGAATTVGFNVDLGNLPGVSQTGAPNSLVAPCQGVGIGGATESPHALWAGVRFRTGGTVENPIFSGFLSSYGAFYGNTASTSGTLSFLAAGNVLRDCGGGTWAGGDATLRLSTQFATTRRADGSLELINNAGATTLTQALDVNSLSSFDFGPGTFPPAGISGNLVNVFAQVELSPAGTSIGDATSKLSNIVVVTVSTTP